MNEFALARGVGNYSLLHKLGEGTFGVVYLARDIRSGQLVALKILKDLDYAARFLQEARLLYEQMRNAHIVRLIDHDLAHCPPYIVTEYCSGGSLRAWARQARPWQDVARVIRHAAVGLSSLHAKGGFHRDVKPDNLLLWESPDRQKSIVKLCDLGLGRGPVNLFSPHCTNSPQGTRGYMAPEILRGAAFSTSADVYSLGVTALELLTGSYDLAALTVIDCPEPLKRLVRSMLSLRPHQRPTAYAIAQCFQVLAGKKAWAAQAPAPPQADWGAVFAIGLVIGLAAWLLPRSAR